MLNKAQIVELLTTLGARPNQNLGQNFLVDENVVKKAVESAQVKKGDRVLEIGPGLGAFTGALLDLGAELTAIEIDRAYAKFLRETFPSLDLVEADALKFDYAAEAAKGEFKIVANLPFCISSPLLDAFLDGLPSCMLIIVQKELAQKYIATSGKPFGALPIFLQSAYDLRIVQTIAPSSFHPAPAVESCLLELRRKPNPVRFGSKAKKLIRSLFLNRRKQLHKGAKANPVSAAWFDVLVAEGKVAPTVRAEDIPLELWQQLATGESDLSGN